MDFFKDLDDIRNSFHLFAKKIPKDGQLYINGEIANYEEITKDLECEVLTYGITDPAYGTNYHLYDIRAENIKSDNLTGQSFDLYYKDKFIDRIMLKAVGIHNISNSLPAIGIALNEQIPIETIKNSLKHFKCAHRRFQYREQLAVSILWMIMLTILQKLPLPLLPQRPIPIIPYGVSSNPTFSRTKRHLKDLQSPYP